MAIKIIDPQHVLAVDMEVCRLRKEADEHEAAGRTGKANQLRRKAQKLENELTAIRGQPPRSSK